MEKTDQKLISSSVYASLNRLLQAILDSAGRGEIIVAKCDSGRTLELISVLLNGLDITPHIYKPEKWEDIRKVWIDFKDNPDWGVAIWKMDMNTPQSVFKAINYNRDLFLDAKWPSVFWVSSQAMKRLITEAPDFWRYRAAYIPFPPVPEPTRHPSLYTASVLRETIEDVDEIKKYISFLKKLVERVKEPVRRARFLAELGRNELKLFILTGDANYLESGIQHLEEALKNKKFQETKDLFTAQALNDLGYSYYLKGDYDRAIEFFNEALKIKLKVLGKEHPDIAGAYNNMGVAYADKGDYDRAIEFFNRALEIYQKVLGEKHPNIAVTYNNLGLAYWNKGNYDRAIEFFKKALEIYLKVLGEEHPYTAETYDNLGAVYGMKGDYNRAIEFFHRALTVFERRLGGCHPYTKRVLKNLSMAYAHKGDNETAKKLKRRLSECA